MAQHQILVFNPSGFYVGDLTTSAVNFRYVRAVNDRGYFEVEATDADWPMEWRDIDYQYHFWRRPNGGDWGLEFVGLCPDRFTDTQGSITTKRVEGFGVNDLLDRRIIAYKAGTAQSKKTDYLDDMCKAIVNDNLGSGASDARNILTAFNMSIAPDLSDAPSVTKSFAYENVLETLQALADTSAGQASGAVDLFFDIACDSYRSNERPHFEFRTYTGQPGRDRTDGGGNSSATVFSLENANIANVHYQRIHSGERNYIYAGGLGLESDRNVVEASDTARIAESPVNRRELFVSATHLADANASEAAYEALNENRPTRKLTCDLLDTETTRYGADWDWGDKVTVYYGEGKFDEIVRVVDVQVRNKKETIKATFGFGATIGNAVAPLMKEIKRLKRDLARQAAGGAEFAKYMGTGSSVPTTTELPRQGMWYNYKNGLTRRRYENFDGTNIRFVTVT